MFIIRHRNIFFAITGVISALALGAILVFGLRFGIEFTGGALIEASYPGGRADKAAIEEKLTALDIGGFSLRPTNETAYLLRTRDLVDDDHERVLSALSLDGEVEVVEESYSTLGPIISQELRNKALVAIALVALMITLYVAFAFRGVTSSAEEKEKEKEKREEGVGSFTYGLVTILALAHDVIVPAGVFAFLGYFLGVEVDVLFVTAILTILGYSVNDTIVVFDRVRENIKLARDRKENTPFAEITGRSLEETYGRSINTSLTTLLAVLALYFFGGAATQWFALTLAVGIIAGTYSSVFFAAPLLVYLTERKLKKAKLENA